MKAVVRVPVMHITTAYAMENEELDILKMTELQWRQKPAAGEASDQPASRAGVSREGKNV